MRIFFYTHCPWAVFHALGERMYAGRPGLTSLSVRGRHNGRGQTLEMWQSFKSRLRISSRLFGVSSCGSKQGRLQGRSQSGLGRLHRKRQRIKTLKTEPRVGSLAPVNTSN